MGGWNLRTWAMPFWQPLLRKSWGLLLFLALAALPSSAQAAGLGFRNDCQVPIIVQGATMVNNMLRRGQPILILPGKTAWDNNVPPGFRILTIYDANQPSRVLCRDRINFSGQDLRFVIRPVPNSKDKVVIQPLP